MTRAAAVVLLAIVSVLASAAAATADPLVAVEDDEVAVRHRVEQANAARYSAMQAAYEVNPYVVVQIPACSGNDINAGIDSPCQQAIDACPPGEVMMQFHRGLSSMTIGDPGWDHLFTRCTAPVAPGTVFPGVTLEDFQRLPLPAGTSTVEPPGEYVLVTMPTNVFATGTDPVLLQTETLGVPVQVRATPARWSWDMGDGATVGPFASPGAAYPALTHTHPYAARGTYDITMTTHYTGEYSLDGSTWIPIPGEAEVASAPATRTALAGHNVLVADADD